MSIRTFVAVACGIGALAAAGVDAKPTKAAKKVQLPKAGAVVKGKAAVQSAPLHPTDPNFTKCKSLEEYGQRFTVVKTANGRNLFNNEAAYNGTCNSVAGLSPAVIRGKASTNNSNWDSAVRTLLRCSPADTVNEHIKGKKHAKIHSWDTNNYGGNGSLVAPGIYPYKANNWGNGPEVGAVNAWATTEEYALCSGWPTEVVSNRCDLGNGAFVTVEKSRNRAAGNDECKKVGGDLFDLASANWNATLEALRSKKEECKLDNRFYIRSWNNDTRGFPSQDLRFALDIYGDNGKGSVNIFPWEEFPVQFASLCSQN